MPLISQVQIIIDVAFFMVIMLFLHQMNKHIARMPKVDDTAIDEFRKLISESQKSTDLFLHAIREGEERLGNLARKLDNRERRMLVLIEMAESMIQKMGLGKTVPEREGQNDDKYFKIKRFLQEGLSREEVAERLGVTVGEVDLVMELEQTKTIYS